MKNNYLFHIALLAVVFINSVSIKAASLPHSYWSETSIINEKNPAHLFDKAEDLIRSGNRKEAIAVYSVIPNHPLATTKDILDAANQLVFWRSAERALPLYRSIVTHSQATASQILQSLNMLSTLVKEPEFITKGLMQIAAHHPSATAAEKAEAINKLREMGLNATADSIEKEEVARL